MDCSEATNIVLTKIKSIDPENASKIMGFLLISLEESELVRLCCSPDHVLHSLILRAKSQLCLSSNSSTSSAIPSPPSPLNPIARPTISNPFSQSSPRIGDNGFDFSRNPSSPSSHSWVFSGLPNSPISPNSSTLLSYKNIRAGFPNDPANTVKDFVDEHQINDYFSFLNESSTKNEDLVDPQLQSGHGVNNWQSVNNGDVVPFHRRCFSASDVCFEPEEAGPGIGHKLCLYYARGHCKNGNNCKFVHGVLPDSLDAPIVGCPSRFEGFEQREEFMRLKAAIQQRMMASPRLSTGVSPSSHDQYLNFLMQQQSDPQSQRAAAALMMGEEFIPFGRGRLQRNDFSAMVSAERLNSASRQIYLTFPAESTFKDEDVSDYFSQFGPVQDVRIPYQQKRMFGFVTFVYPETVRLILAKGNPHFICDSRVLVKPYKEKGKAPEKRQQHQPQQFDRGDFSPSLSPMGFDSKEPYDHLGARGYYSPQEILFRRQLEQHELQKAIELQGRRLMDLQLPDFKNNPINHHHRSLSVGSPLPLPQLNSNISNAVLTPDSIKGDIAGYSGTQAPTISLPTAASLDEMQQKQEDVTCIHDDVGGHKKENTNTEVFDKNLEQVLPDSLSASPTNAAGDLPDSSALPDANERAAFSTSSSHHNSEPPAKSVDISSR